MNPFTPLLGHLLTLGRVAEAELTRLLRAHGLNATDFQLLSLLRESHVGSLAELSRLAGLSRQACRRSLEHLEHYDWVERLDSRDDRRATEFHLTREGERHLARVEQFLADVTHRAARALGPHRDEVHRALITLRQELPEPLRLPWWD